MEPETVYGATLLFHNLPPAALVGIDLISFTSSPRFKGIKHLPAGLHLAFASATTSLSIRHGAWFRVQDDPTSIQVFVKRWNDQDEELVTELDEANLLACRANLGAIWREGLSPYRQTAANDGTETEEKDDWKTLTSCISDGVLSRLTGHAKDVWSLTSASSAKRDLDEIPGLQTESANHTFLNVLIIDLKNTWPPGATGRERTLAARDHSWALAHLIDNHCQGDAMQLLGELQFCFLIVLTLNNHSCLEQWKRIIELLFTCTTAVIRYPQLYIETVRTLRIQLQHCQDVEGGLFDLSEDAASFLKNILRKFKKTLVDIDSPVKRDIDDQLDELGSFLRKNHGWDLEDNFVRRGIVVLDDGEALELTLAGYEEEDESGEYAPTIVELSDGQLETLSGSSNHSNRAGQSAAEESELEHVDARY